MKSNRYLSDLLAFSACGLFFGFIFGVLTGTAPEARATELKEWIAALSPVLGAAIALYAARIAWIGIQGQIREARKLEKEKRVREEITTLMVLANRLNTLADWLDRDLGITETEFEQNELTTEDYLRMPAHMGLIACLHDEMSRYRVVLLTNPGQRNPTNLWYAATSAHTMQIVMLQIIAMFKFDPDFRDEFVEGRRKLSRTILKDQLRDRTDKDPFATVFRSGQLDGFVSNIEQDPV